MLDPLELELQVSEFWDLNVNTLYAQQVLLTIAPFLQPLTILRAESKQFTQTDYPSSQVKEKLTKENKIIDFCENW